MTRLAIDDAIPFRDRASMRAHYRAVRQRLAGRPMPVARAPFPQEPSPPATPAPRPPRRPEPPPQQPPAPPPIRIALVLRMVARFFDVPVPALTSTSRLPKFVWPRLVAMAMARRVSGRPFDDVARAFNRAHTTAMNACRQVEERAAQDPAVAATLTLLEAEIRTAAKSEGRA